MTLALSFCSICVIAVLSFLWGYHEVQQGFVGAYYSCGVLLPETTEPGIHFKWPWQKVELVQVSIQTDQVTNIPCGTSGGIMIHFEKIEVVNRLSTNHVIDTLRNYTANYDKIWIYDKIHHEINQYCSKNTLEDIYIKKFDSLDEELISAL